MRISLLAHSLLPSILLNAAAVAAVPSGDYCAPTTPLYSQDRWTYAEVQVCLRFGSKGTQVVVKNNNPQYYWGGAWYNASPKHPAKWNAAGKVDDTETYDISATYQESVTDQAVASLEPKDCGAHTVTMKFNQEGPYWGDEVRINNDSTHTINVPC